MITIDINDAQITAALQSALSQMQDMTAIMDDIGDLLLASTKDRFGKAVAPDGTPWAPNSPVTLSRKKGTRPLLGQSGALSSGIFTETGSDYLYLGSNAIQAAVMQFGAKQGEFGAATGRTRKIDKVKSHDYFTPLPWGDIPARPFLGLSDQDKENIFSEVSEALAAALTP